MRASANSTRPGRAKHRAHGNDLAVGLHEDLGRVEVVTDFDPAKVLVQPNGKIVAVGIR